MKAATMIIHPFSPERCQPSLPTTLDEVRVAVESLLDSRHGGLRLADALVTVAAEIATRQAGRQGAAIWLRGIAEDVRTGRVQA